MWQLVILAASVYTVAAHIPVVLWHGMGDSCCDPRSMGRVMDQINEQLPGIHIVSVKIGDTAEQDQNASFFDQISRQVDLVCETLAQDPLLVNGFNAMGFSQGGLFLRAYVQRCNNPPVRNLLTFGSPHGGVAAAPGCMDDSNFKCKLMRSVIKNGVYLSWVQSRLVQAQYFKEWDNYEEYLENSIFLADINNERPVTRPEYATRLTSLQKFVMVQFNNDTMIVPKETAWFSFYNSNGTLVPVQEQTIYTALGLDELERQGKIDWISFNGDHLQFPDGAFAGLVAKYLSNPRPFRIQMT